MVRGLTRSRSSVNTARTPGWFDVVGSIMVVAVTIVVGLFAVKEAIELRLLGGHSNRAAALR